MIPILLERLKQKHRTIKFPSAGLALPERACGRPSIKGICPDACDACIGVCPTNAITRCNSSIALDMGRCIFCGACTKACTGSHIFFSRSYELAARSTKDMCISHDQQTAAIKALDKNMQRLFKRSLKLRQVSAGGCNVCEADVNVLNTVVFDLSRFGISFVASPRHADGLLVTGPVTQNMKLALQKTYEAVGDPKIVIAVGACAISGGLFRDQAEVCNGADKIVPVDLYIPGCPPHPLTTLDGMLRLLGRL